MSSLAHNILLWHQAPGAELYFVVGAVSNIVDSDQVNRKIDSFANLAVGWDYGSGGPIPFANRDLAKDWKKFLNEIGIVDIDAFPGGSGGETVLAVGSGDHYIEVIIESDLRVSVAYDFNGKQQLYEPNKSDDEARAIVRNLATGVEGWNAFDYFTQINITVNNANLPDPLLETFRVAYQSWSGDVFKRQAILSRTISGNITNVTRGSLQTRRYFGNLIPIFSPVDTGSSKKPLTQEMYAITM
jgi:hypothetical protein